jgi:hypothetical protein
LKRRRNILTAIADKIRARSGGVCIFDDLHPQPMTVIIFKYTRVVGRRIIRQRPLQKSRT